MPLLRYAPAHHTTSMRKSVECRDECNWSERGAHENSANGLSRSVQYPPVRSLGKFGYEDRLKQVASKRPRLSALSQAFPPASLSASGACAVLASDM